MKSMTGYVPQYGFDYEQIVYNSLLDKWLKRNGTPFIEWSSYGFEYSTYEAAKEKIEAEMIFQKRREELAAYVPTYIYPPLPDQEPQ